MKNVARTYSLEHEGESVLFDQLFQLLNSSMRNEESYRRELASRTGALQTSITQHMSKEEEQVSIYFLFSNNLASLSVSLCVCVFPNIFAEHSDY